MGLWGTVQIQKPGNMMNLEFHLPSSIYSFSLGLVNNSQCYYQVILEFYDGNIWMEKY